VVMTNVAHRELRNNSAELLRRANAGESFDVTNNGVVVARLVPPEASPLERALQAHLVTPATSRRLPRITRVRSAESTAAMLKDLKGER